MSSLQKKILVWGLLFFFLGSTLWLVYIFVRKGPNSETIQQIIKEDSVQIYNPSSNKIETEMLQEAAALQKLYALNQYFTIWTKDSIIDTASIQTIEKLTSWANSCGIDYPNKALENLKTNNWLFTNYSEAIKTDIMLSDMALNILLKGRYGLLEYQISYDELQEDIDTLLVCKNLLTMVQNSSELEQTLALSEPYHVAYILLKEHFNKIQNRLIDFPYIDSVSLIETNFDTTHFFQKAFILGITDSLQNAQNANLDSIALKFAQLFNLADKSIYQTEWIAEVAKPISYRLQQIKESLHIWRWVQRKSEKQMLVANTGSAMLRYFDTIGNPSLSMRIIIGTSHTPTPRLATHVYAITTYPYWNVPYSIASKEILPKVKKNITYLKKNNLEVLNKEGKSVDPEKINWKNISERTLPYKFRQATGCDNALGVLKFEIRNPFSIYLHDTNNRKLFANRNRHLSHGCVRLEKPLELAMKLIPDYFDRDYMDLCLTKVKPQRHKLTKEIPVILVYSLSDINEKGELRFFKNVYQLEASKN
jgi:murein L,D-transpeptidase YcbB/YkuD